MRVALALCLIVLAGCRQQPLSREAARGLELVGQYGCGSCHVIPGVTGADGMAGPPLTAMARQAYVAGVAPNTREALTRFIADPRAVDPRSAMPDLGLLSEEAQYIAAYLYEAGASE